jgi:hypothetical protein
VRRRPDHATDIGEINRSRATLITPDRGALSEAAHRISAAIALDMTSETPRCERPRAR